MSLRTRLLTAILVTLSIVGGISLTKSYLDSRHEVQELFDAQLAATARLMLSMALTGIADGDLARLQDRLLESTPDPEAIRPPAGSEYTVLGHSYEIKLAFQVWDRAGNLVLRSGNSPLHPLSHALQGFSDSTLRGENWRVFGLWNPEQTYRVQTGQRYDVRDEMIEKIAERVSLPFFVLPILAVSLWFAVGRALRPLDHLAEQVSNRDARNLRPVEEPEVPEEVRPLILALNRLLERLDSSLDKERRFTADAAHELRTPLAALRTHVQLALSAQDKVTLKNALRQTLVGVDRATHLVEQLLSLARLEPQSMAAAGESINLRAILIETVAQLTPIAIDRQQDIGIDEGELVRVNGSPDATQVLIRNLVDNAIRYTPIGGQIRIALLSEQGRAVLQIEDSGPGITPDRRDQVFERFYRGDERASGCGIGLSIVKRIVDIHNAEIVLDRSTDLGGLRTRVIFPPVHD